MLCPNEKDRIFESDMLKTDETLCYTTNAMAMRVKQLEKSLSTLQLQAKKMVASCSSIETAAQKKACIAVNIKDHIFENLVPVVFEADYDLLKRKSKPRACTKLDPHRDEGIKAEEDRLENIPADLKELRSDQLNCKSDVGLKSWISQHYPFVNAHITSGKNTTLSVDDYWNCL